MGPSETILESIEYRIAFVSADSVKVLVLENSSGYEMPRVSIPRWTRPARELRKAIHACFGIHALILDLSLAGGLWGRSRLPRCCPAILAPRSCRWTSQAF